MKLLIVVDKLLTGFDAPSATYLYIDKKMADHNLFTAKEDLETAWEAVQMMAENVPVPKTFPEYKAYFCGADDKTNLQTEYQGKRLAFYRAAAKLIPPSISA